MISLAINNVHLSPSIESAVEIPQLSLRSFLNDILLPSPSLPSVTLQFYRKMEPLSQQIYFLDAFRQKFILWQINKKT